MQSLDLNMWLDVEEEDITATGIDTALPFAEQKQLTWLSLELWGNAANSFALSAINKVRLVVGWLVGWLAGWLLLQRHGDKFLLLHVSSLRQGVCCTLHGIACLC